MLKTSASDTSTQSMVIDDEAIGVENWLSLKNSTEAKNNIGGSEDLASKLPTLG